MAPDVTTQKMYLSTQRVCVQLSYQFVTRRMNNHLSKNNLSTPKWKGKIYCQELDRIILIHFKCLVKWFTPFAKLTGMCVRSTWTYQAVNLQLSTGHGLLQRYMHTNTCTVQFNGFVGELGYLKPVHMSYIYLFLTTDQLVYYYAGLLSITSLHHSPSCAASIYTINHIICLKAILI